MSKAVLSDAIQDYLKEIYNLGQEGGRVTVTGLARRLHVSPASVSAMVKKLAALGLVDHRAYRSFSLTPDGEKIALEVIRHHRLLELYLAETLGLSIDAVHDEADRLEHVLSEELEAKIDAALGHPTHDPHGHPIPSADLVVTPAGPARQLTDLEAGEETLVRHVPDGDAARLRHLSKLGVLPGRRLQLTTKQPLTVRVDGEEHVLPRELAAEIGVD